MIHNITSVDALINQDCPHCQSKRGNVVSYMPIMTTDYKLEIEIECEQCGCYCKLICIIESANFEPSI